MSSYGNAVFHLEGHLGAEVVPEVLAYAGEMTDRVYPKLQQLVLRPDARDEQVGRSDLPGAQHHPVGFGAEHFLPFSASTPTALPSLIMILPDEHPAPQTA
jgi:hypothetical protein